MSTQRGTLGSSSSWITTQAWNNPILVLNYNHNVLCGESVLGALAISQMLWEMWGRNEKLMFQVHWIIRLMSSLTPRHDDRNSPFVKLLMCFSFLFFCFDPENTKNRRESNNSDDIITVSGRKGKRRKENSQIGCEQHIAVTHNRTFSLLKFPQNNLCSNQMTAWEMKWYRALQTLWPFSNGLNDSSVW